MKQTILALLLALTLCVPASAQRHSNKSKAQTEAVDQNKQDEGIVAYSDTTGAPNDSVAEDSFAAESDTAGLSDYNTQNNIQEDDIDTLREVMTTLTTTFAPFLIFLFIAFLAVCILIFLLIRMLIKSNERRRAEAMNQYQQYQYYNSIHRESAQQTTTGGNQQGQQKNSQQSQGQAFQQGTYQGGYNNYEYDDRSLWQRLSSLRLPDDPQSRQSYYRGVRNFFLGIGLALLFFIMDLEALAGVGLLIACWGIGQIVIALSFGQHYHNPNQPYRNREQYQQDQSYRNGEQHQKDPSYGYGEQYQQETQNPKPEEETHPDNQPKE
ncbi:MAG: DUF6249 domain-containing protein [Prevotella sp.]|jgi:predicted membrane protein